MLLTAKTEKYAHLGPPQPGDKTNAPDFPDSVLDPLIRKSGAATQALFARHQSGAPDEFALMKKPDTTPGPPLELRDSKQLVVDALTDYDPALGARAQDILDHRLRAEKFSPENKDPLQCYVPAGDKERPAVAGTIQYDYLTGGIEDPIMLGHELGHALADDNIRNNTRPGPGGTTRQYTDDDQLGHMQETQAYFVQNIVYDYLRKHPDEAISTPAARSYTATMTRNIYNLGIAGIARDAQQALSEGRAFDTRQAFDARLGPRWDKYDWAQRVFNTITDAQKAQNDASMPEADRQKAMEKLNVEADYVHGRPASLLSARILYQQVQGADVGTKQRVAGALLAAGGPKNLVNVLSEAGIVDSGGLENQAQAAIDDSTAYIRVQLPKADAGLSAQNQPVPPNT